MRLVYWFYHCIRNYANHQGRASRVEFWAFQLTTYGTGLFIAALSRSAPAVGVLFWWGFSLLMARPSVAVSVRRLHDIGHSGQLLRRLMILGVTQAAFWFGWAISNFKDRLVYSAAISVSIVSMLIAASLIVLYCRRGPEGPNEYGPPAPKDPLLAL